MDDPKADAKSLAENLNLKLRGVAQRVLPEYFQSDPALEASIQEFGLHEKPKYRAITPTERLDFCQQYLYLDDDLIYYTEQKQSLREEFLRLNKELDRKIARCEAGKERLREALRTSLIAVQCSEVEEKASAATNLISPSKDLGNK